MQKRKAQACGMATYGLVIASAGTRWLGLDSRRHITLRFDGLSERDDAGARKSDQRKGYIRPSNPLIELGILPGKPMADPPGSVQLPVGGQHRFQEQGS